MGNTENFVDDSQVQHFWNVSRRDFLRRILKQKLGNYPVNRYLDIGSGAGVTAAGIAQALRAQTVWLSDTSPDALKLSQNLAYPIARRILLDLSLATAPNSLPHNWDFITVLDVIEHIQDDSQALRNITSLLRPGGYALITVPANQKLFSAYDEYVGHHRRYTALQLHRVGAQAGLHVVSWNYFMSLTYPLYLIGRARLQQRVRRAHTQEERSEILEKARTSSPAALNTPLRALINFEAVLNPYLRFPWGSSLYTIFQKPDKSTHTPRR